MFPNGMLDEGSEVSREEESRFTVQDGEKKSIKALISAGESHHGILRAIGGDQE